MLATFLNDAYQAMQINAGTDCILTDFSKAYDSIWHNGSIYKLCHEYNIKGKFLNCIIQFISNIYTRVVTKKGSSS